MAPTCLWQAAEDGSASGCCGAFRLMFPQTSIHEAKRAMRSTMIARRRQALAATPQISSLITAAFSANLNKYKDKIIALYSALEGEISLGPLAEQLTREWYQLALPVITGKGKALQFRRYCWGDPLAGGVWQIQEPLPDQPTLEPDLLLVPLLAFDAAGNRLGYGGGYYDRTLHTLRQSKRIMAVGVALNCLEVPQVPVEAHDQKLNAVLTETGWKTFALE